MILLEFTRCSTETTEGLSVLDAANEDKHQGACLHPAHVVKDSQQGGRQVPNLAGRRASLGGNPPEPLLAAWTGLPQQGVVLGLNKPRSVTREGCTRPLLLVTHMQ